MRNKHWALSEHHDFPKGDLSVSPDDVPRNDRLPVEIKYVVRLLGTGSCYVSCLVPSNGPDSGAGAGYVAVSCVQGCCGITALGALEDRHIPWIVMLLQETSLHVMVPGIGRGKTTFSPSMIPLSFSSCCPAPDRFCVWPATMDVKGVGWPSALMDGGDVDLSLSWGRAY
ncbi:hypothetical protein RRG08_018941 [Elysia crispata]|uniref:Uncharacterized protein n=1 Tax=Elysia crispata TaxID=231223 RepID=A0AAE1A4R6_9GAST|nr:hypothetical protein RRG08_018941 [Elysia crispata]